MQSFWHLEFGIEIVTVTLKIGCWFKFKGSLRQYFRAYRKYKGNGQELTESNPSS